MLLHEGQSTYLELSSKGERCPRCGALLTRDGRKYFSLDGLQIIQRPRPGEKPLKEFALAVEHTPERCEGRKR